MASGDGLQSLLSSTDSENNSASNSARSNPRGGLVTRVMAAMAAAGAGGAGADAAGGGDAPAMDDSDPVDNSGRGSKRKSTKRGPSLRF